MTVETTTLQAQMEQVMELLAATVDQDFIRATHSPDQTNLILAAHP